MEPPTVPRLRVAGCPTCRSAAVSRGARSLATAERRASAWRVVAPIRRAPFAEIPESSATRPTSTSAEGRASRRFSMGTRLCPPASTRAVLPELRQHRDRVFDGLGDAISERSRLHEAASLLPRNTRGQVRNNGVRPARCGPGPIVAYVTFVTSCAVRENRGLGSSWVSWVVVAGGGAVLWSCVGIERTRKSELRRRLLLGVGIVVVGFASFAVTGSSSDSAAGARRVADAFTLARLTRGARGGGAVSRARCCAARGATAGQAVADRSGCSPRRRHGSFAGVRAVADPAAGVAQRALRALRRRLARVPLEARRPLVRGRLHPALKQTPRVR